MPSVRVCGNRNFLSMILKPRGKKLLLWWKSRRKVKTKKNKIKSCWYEEWRARDSNGVYVCV